MQGEIIKAAKWLGGCMIAASLILVIGFHPTVTGRILTFTSVQPVVTDQPIAPGAYMAPQSNVVPAPVNAF